jgi:uncharacterized membrane protein YesL
MMASQLPEVKPMKGLFKPDSGLMIFMTQVTDCIFLSLFFLVGCVPVVTAGASFAALYDAVYRGFRKGEKNTWLRFVHVFRTNWKAGILPTLVFFAAVAGLGYGMIQCWNGAVYGHISWMLFAGLAFAAVVLAGVLSVLFPMLSRFENSLGALLRNTVILALANLPRTVALGVVNAVVALLCLRFIIPLFFLPALAALIGSLCIEPMFKPFMPEEPEEEAAE